MVKWRLQTKISIIFILIILIPLATINVILVFHTENQLREAGLSSLQSFALETGNELNRFITHEQDQFSIISKNPVLQCKNRNCSEKLGLLQFMKELRGIYDDITLISLDGRVIASTDYNYRGEWTSNKWFNEARNGSYVVSDATIISDPIRVIISFFSPVYTQKGNLTAVLAGQMHFREIWKLLDNLTIGETGYVSLINDNGIIISHPNKELIFTEMKHENPVSIVLSKKSGTALYTEPDEKTYIYGFTPVFSELIYENKGGNWGIVVSQEADEVLTGVATLQQQMIIVFLVFIIIYLIVTNLFSKHFINPIYRLADGMKAVAQGNLNSHVKISSGDEIELLGNSFNKMTDDLRVLQYKVDQRTNEIESLLKQKDEFINQLGHDLKNPLVPISNLMPVLEEHVTNPKAKKYYEIINRNFNYMKNLVIDTLKLARINSAYVKTEFQSLNLKQIVPDVINDNQHLFEEKNIKITNNVDENLYINADEIQLKEVLNNLLSNAIKFVENPKGHIIIDAHPTANIKFIKITVTDNGIGLEKQETTKIFEEFYKSDESRHDLNSSGLGLSICKKIVERHGGKIWAESPGLGKGSSFHFTLPADEIKK